MIQSQFKSHSATPDPRFLPQNIAKLYDTGLGRTDMMHFAAQQGNAWHVQMTKQPFILHGAIYPPQLFSMRNWRSTFPIPDNWVSIPTPAVIFQFWSSFTAFIDPALTGESRLTVTSLPSSVPMSTAGPKSWFSLGTRSVSGEKIGECSCNCQILVPAHREQLWCSSYCDIWPGDKQGRDSIFNKHSLLRIVHTDSLRTYAHWSEPKDRTSSWVAQGKSKMRRCTHPLFSHFPMSDYTLQRDSSYFTTHSCHYALIWGAIHDWVWQYRLPKPQSPWLHNLQLIWMPKICGPALRSSLAVRIFGWWCSTCKSDGVSKHCPVQAGWKRQISSWKSSSDVRQSKGIWRWLWLLC